MTIAHDRRSKPWLRSCAHAPVFALAALARPSRQVIAIAPVLAVLALVVGRGGGWPAWYGAPELHLAVLAVLATAHAAVGIDALIEGERRALLAQLCTCQA